MAFKKYLVCGVSIPSADQINPELLKTAVFTWAEGEPKKPITESSCVIVSGDSRWCLANCADRQSVTSNKEKYSNPLCHGNMEFSVPHNGYQQQQLVKAAKGRTVWINLTPFFSSLKGKNGTFEREE